MKSEYKPDKTVNPQILDYVNKYPNCQFSLNELLNVVPDNSSAPKTIAHRLGA